MIIHPLPLMGAFTIDQEPIGDDRGSFARAFCQRELAEAGIEFEVRQVNNSVSAKAGTVRGFHFQFPPHAEDKLLRCVRGAVVDCLVDLRPESPTFLQTHMVELTAENRRTVLIPKRFAHVVQMQADDSEILYLVSEFYAPEAESGLRWDDPDLDIQFPLPVTDISDKDASWPLLAEQRAVIEERMKL